MSTKVESGYARSETLQKEWDGLKKEMEKLVTQLARRPNEKQERRKVVVEERMHAITAEMASVLSETRKEVPSAGFEVPVDDSDDDSMEDGDHTILKTMSRPERAQICRTYDSTDSEDDPDSNVSADVLRDRMRRDALAKDPHAKMTTVTIQSKKGFGLLRGGDAEKPPSPEADGAGKKSRGGALLSGKAGGKRSKLRGLKAVLGIKAASKPRELTLDECEALRLESSRLERQMRKFKKKKGGPVDHSAEMARIQARLAEVSKELETGVTTRPLCLSDDDDSPGSSDPGLSLPGYSPTSKDVKSSADSTKSGSSPGGDRSGLRQVQGSGRGLFGAPSSKPSTKGSTAPSSPEPPMEDARSQGSRDSSTHGLPAVVCMSDDDDDPIEDEHEYAAPKSKTMTQLGHGVMSIRQRMKKDMFASKREQQPVVPGPDTKRSGDALGPSPTSSGNPYVEVTDKLAERGEQLASLNKGADEMTENAGEAASAAAALRKRQQKTGLFW